MATRLQDKKADLLERVVDQLHDKLADGQAERAEAFVRHYYRAVAPDRSARARPPRHLRRRTLASPPRRAASARPVAGPGLQPADRAARLAVDPHRGRGGHRRHAVPGRFGEHGVEPAGPPDPHHDPPGRAGQTRARRRARGGAGLGRRRRRRRPLRVVHAFRSRPAERSRADRGDPRRPRAGARGCPGGGRGLANDARQGRGRDRRPAGRRQGARADRAGRGRGVPALDRRRPLHPARLRLLRPDPRSGGRSAEAPRGLGARPAQAPADRQRHLAQLRSIAAGIAPPGARPRCRW